MFTIISDSVMLTQWLTCYLGYPFCLQVTADRRPHSTVDRGPGVLQVNTERGVRKFVKGLTADRRAPGFCEALLQVPTNHRPRCLRPWTWTGPWLPQVIARITQICGGSLNQKMKSLH